MERTGARAGTPYNRRVPRLLRVASLDEIPIGRGKAVEADCVAVAVFNGGGGRYYACGAACPHEDGPLGDGALEGTTVICPWHGFDFDLESGACRVDRELSVAVYPVRVHGTDVLIELP